MGNIVNITFDTIVGALIAINGKVLVAQKIIVQLSEDFSIPQDNKTKLIIMGNLTNIIIDNEKMFKSDAKKNSFKIKED